MVAPSLPTKALVTGVADNLVGDLTDLSEAAAHS